MLIRNFTLLPFAALIDAIRLAADDGDGSRQIACQWTIMGENREHVRASCGVEIAPWERFRDPDSLDYIAVVGGILRKGDAAPPAVLDYLRLAGARERSLIGLGTGTFALAQAGVMAGYRCCLSWYHLEAFRNEFPDLRASADLTYLVDRNRITCAGGTAAVDLAAHLIERNCGRPSALKSLRMILSDAPRSSGNPQPGPVMVPAVTDNRVRRAILLLEQNLATLPSPKALAREVDISPRQLQRLFREETRMSVMEFARLLRVHRAQWLLRHSPDSITAIAQECGFSDSAHLARVFRGRIGLTPSSFRKAAAPDKQLAG